MQNYDSERVGSNLDNQALSSFVLGAARAYEFDDVKRVNVWGFYEI